MLCLRLTTSGRAPLKIPCGYAFYLEEEKAAKSFSELIKILNTPIIASVGDVVTLNIISNNLLPNIAIIDGKTRRLKKLDFRNMEKNFNYILKAKNPPSTITVEALGILGFASLIALSGNRVLVIVDGEEDLLAIPLVYLLPPNSIILYGLMDTALVALHVSHYLKKSILKFVGKYFVVGEC